MSLNDYSFTLKAQVIESLISSQFRQMKKRLFHVCHRTLSIEGSTDAHMLGWLIEFSLSKHMYLVITEGEPHGAFVFEQNACNYSLLTTKLDLFYNKK